MQNSIDPGPKMCLLRMPVHRHGAHVSVLQTLILSKNGGHGMNGGDIGAWPLQNGPLGLGPCEAIRR
eukprot:3482872-Karenia_brevis.AAC.1